MKIISKIIVFVFLTGTLIFLLPNAHYVSREKSFDIKPFIFVEGDWYRVTKKKFDDFKSSVYRGAKRGDVFVINEKAVVSPWKFYSAVYVVELKHRMKWLSGDRAEYLYKDESWFLESVKNDPSNREKTIQLSEFYRYNGDYRKAEDVLLAFLKRHDDDEVLVSLGFLYTSNGKLDEGALFLRKAIEINPNNPNVYTVLGKVYRNQGKHQEAQVEFGKAKRIAPTDPTVYFYEGYNYLDQELYDLAEESFGKMMNAGATAPALVGIADVLSRKKEYGKAEEMYLKALKMDPTLEMPYLGLGYMYIEIGRYKMAERVLKLALDLNKKSDSLSAMGFLYIETGRPEKAIEFFGEALLLDKNYIEGYMNLARAYDQIDDFESAAYNARKRASYKKNDEALVFLGEIYMKADRIGEAAEYWRKSGSWYGEKYLLENGLADDIQKSLEVIATASETDEEAARFLSDYYLKTGNFDKYQLLEKKIRGDLDDGFWKFILRDEVLDKFKLVKVLVNTDNERWQIEKIVSASSLSTVNKKKVVFGT